MMTPTSVAQVEELLLKKLTWKFGASGMGACKRIVKDALDALPAKYPHRDQLKAYLIEKTKLEKMLDELGE
ncbi:hypothetical protein [Runella salmonicolor]|uniref:Uncharacterized protein n=1 Tax=Runella salmonicolor TaxID=2950278 RepID=A0ABT1FRT6_9BACT|nr:hypothetical protein [Runella salmonicolor]MCP1384477.1 hypothetical protein [Runella salmonicolor]